MATQKLENVVSFIETQLRTLTQLDVVEYKGEDDPDPKVKNYGAVIYTEGEDYVERIHKHIGPHLTEIWSISADVIIQRKATTPRKTISDAFGVSYWISQLTALFLNKTNSGAFVRTWYTSADWEEVNSGIKLKGLVNIEILNKYT